jgi:hypothetical protein
VERRQATKLRDALPSTNWTLHSNSSFRQDAPELVRPSVARSLTVKKNCQRTPRERHVHVSALRAAAPSIAKLNAPAAARRRAALHFPSKFSDSIVNLIAGEPKNKYPLS